VGYVTGRLSRALIERLRRDLTGLIYAGGRLPEGRAWVESIDYPPGTRQPTDWRWRIVHENGWTNIGSPWPLALIVNAPALSYTRDPETGDVAVEVRRT
jgi:hypothetical protein